jgi:hypothetical protein
MIAKANFTATFFHDFTELRYMLQASMHRGGQQQRRTDSKREGAKAGMRGQQRFEQIGCTCTLNDRSHTLPLQPAGEDRDDTSAMEQSICTAQPLRLRGALKKQPGGLHISRKMGASLHMFHGGPPVSVIPWGMPLRAEPTIALLQFLRVLLCHIWVLRMQAGLFHELPNLRWMAFHRLDPQ